MRCYIIVRIEMQQELEEYVGHKETFNRLIKDMARTLNSDEYDFKPEEEWKIYFHDFKRYYDRQMRAADSEEDEEEEYEEYINEPMRISGLYYNRTFSYEKINSLIEGVLASRTISTKEASDLIEKIEERLRDNLLIIQRAIDHNVQIRFQFNGYTCRKKLEPVERGKDQVSPYYIVSNGGRYYLLACKELQRDGKSLRNMSIWRIDLMTEMEIPEENEKTGRKGIARIARRQVENLPQIWSEDFQLKHLNMSFDKPEQITLRIKSEKRKDDPAKRVRADYTFLHDWFGDNFRFVRSEQKPPYDDIVKVECSPCGMVNWALQYSDRVEIPVFCMVIMKKMAKAWRQSESSQWKIKEQQEEKYVRR